MALATKRLGSTLSQPHTLEVQSHLAGASSLLLHLEALPGVHVIAKKSFALTDDFEAYFTYRNRLWVMETPFSLVEIGLLGQPVDEGAFQEIERHAQKYSPLLFWLLPIAFARYLFVRPTPPRSVFQRFGVSHPSDVTKDAP
jgi:hypothetical protein